MLYTAHPPLRGQDVNDVKAPPSLWASRSMLFIALRPLGGQPVHAVHSSPPLGQPVHAVHRSPASRWSACTCCAQLSRHEVVSLYMLYTALSPLGGQRLNAVHSSPSLGGQPVHAVHSSPACSRLSGKCCTQLSCL
jgi:hypothetical protein